MLVCSIKITHLFFFNFLFFLVVFFFIKYIVLCGPVALYYAGPLHAHTCAGPLHERTCAGPLHAHTCVGPVECAGPDIVCVGLVLTSIKTTFFFWIFLLFFSTFLIFS